MKNLDADRIAEIVTEKLSRDFERIKIYKVNVAQDVDRDGDEILRIQVVFEGKLRHTDARQLAGAARRLRPALMKEIDADLYPLLSFVSKVDYERGPRPREAR